MKVSESERGGGGEERGEGETDGVREGRGRERGFVLCQRHPEELSIAKTARDEPKPVTPCAPPNMAVYFRIERKDNFCFPRLFGVPVSQRRSLNEVHAIKDQQKDGRRLSRPGRQGEGGGEEG